MPKVKCALITAFICASQFSGTVLAREFSGVSSKASYQCKPGEDISVEGTSQTIALTGACGALSISGVSANIRVQQVESIVIEGFKNQVAYGSNALGGKPKIDVSGVSCTIAADKALIVVATPRNASSAAPKSTAAPATLIADIAACGATRTIQGVSNGQAIDCAKGERLLISGVNIVTSISGNCAAICIDGTSNTVTVAGDALSIAIAGTSNSVSATRVDAVSIEGMSNRVSWRTSAYPKGPKSSISGISNGISQL